MVSLTLTWTCAASNQLSGWCQAHFAMQIDIKRGIGTPKLGILAGIFGDGTASIYTVPDPEAVRSGSNVAHDQTIYGASPGTLSLRCIVMRYGS